MWDEVEAISMKESIYDISESHLAQELISPPFVLLSDGQISSLIGQD